MQAFEEMSLEMSELGWGKTLDVAQASDIIPTRGCPEVLTESHVFKRIAMRAWLAERLMHAFLLCCLTV